MEFALAAGVATAGVAAFAAVLTWLRLVPVARALMDAVTSGVTAMLDSALDDEAKERALRVSGLSLLVGSWQVAWRISLALASVALPVLLADFAGLVPRADSLGVLMRVDFIVIISIVAILVSWVFRRGSRAKTDRIVDSSAYGAGDKIIHALAFSGPRALRALSKLDDRIFARAIAEVPETPPVFITSLARGGTTALLNAMHELPQMATHRYCDMPFVSAPVLWSKLAGDRRSVTQRERAHGDGMKIGLQSPEAFDEIFWRLYWPEKYSDRQIDLWQAADHKPGAQAFFLRHFRKIAHLRRPEDTRSGIRYLSKNNANIARLDLLPGLFPGCAVIIALREPAAHAASLHRQHLNFSNLHAEDNFVRRYMHDIGHLEFGALHRPIAFDPEGLAAYEPDNHDYWLAYWIAAFEYIGRHAEHSLLVTQTDLRASPTATMHALIDRLGLTEGRELGFEAYFRRSADPQPNELFDPDLLRRAREIYDRLAEYAIR